MPIHDQGYRRYTGHRRPHGRTWWVIARTQVLAALRYRPFVILLLLSFLPFLGHVGQLYFSTNFQQVEFLAATAQTFRDFLDRQSIFVFLITIALAGVIADDRRANALQVYLSKPLSRVEYVAGKLVAVLVFVLGATLLPALLLLLLQALFAGSTAFLARHPFLLPAIALFSIIQALLAAFAILALSSLSKSRRFVSIMYAGLVFFTAAMCQALRTITGSRAWAVLSPEDTLDVIADAIFRVRGQPAIPVPLAVLSVAVLIGASMWILERRVRGVEVVA